MPIELGDSSKPGIYMLKITSFTPVTPIQPIPSISEKGNFSDKNNSSVSKIDSFDFSNEAKESLLTSTSTINKESNIFPLQENAIDATTALPDIKNQQPEIIPKELKIFDSNKQLETPANMAKKSIFYHSLETTQNLGNAINIII